MSDEVRLPPLGEEVSSGIVLDVLVSPGDRVEADQPVLRLETDKATTEVPASSAGTVAEILVREGQEIRSGDPILRLEGGAGAESRRREGPGESRRDEDRGERPARRDEDRGERAEPGARDRARDDHDEAERRRAVDDGREQEGREDVRRAPPRQKPSESEDLPAPRATMEREAGVQAHDRRERAAFARERQAPSSMPRLGQPVAASPTVRRLARELGVEIGEVAGTGGGGAVTEEDVKSHVRHLLDRFRRTHDQAQPELPDFAAWGPVRREPMQAIRRATARSVARSWQQVPHVTQLDRADITELEAFRRRYADEVAKGGGKLTVTAILVKVCAAALHHFPHFNASLDLERAELVLKDYVHIGVAIDTPAGLLMPVLRDADSKGLGAIATELQSLAERARGRRVGADELKGASFAITNLGGLGTTAFTPIVAWPQVAILGVGRGEVQPVWRDGAFMPRTMLPLGITYDHRAVDGADAARFLRWIAETLEAPLRLTLEG